MAPRLTTLGLFLVLLQSWLPAHGAERIPVLKLHQFHYVLGEVDVYVGKDAVKTYNEQNDVAMVAHHSNMGYCEYSLSRKIKFERSLKDFLKNGSSANWDYDEELLSLPWFPAKADTFLSRKAKLEIAPLNANLVRRLQKKGNEIDLSKHEVAHLWYLPTTGYMPEAEAFLAKLYRLPYRKGLPLEMKGKYAGRDIPFWQQERELSAKHRKEVGVREYLTTKSITEMQVDRSIFDFPNYRTAKKESDVYLSKETNSMLQNMFIPDDRKIDAKKK